MFNELFFAVLFSFIFLVIRGIHDDWVNSEEIIKDIVSIEEADRVAKHIARVVPGQIPSGIASIPYSSEEQKSLAFWYQSTKVDNTRRLLEKIANDVNIYQLFFCATNALNYLKRILDHTGPILFRNCVTCSNAVDLILQSLYENARTASVILHYYANTCEMQTYWVSNAQEKEQLLWGAGEALSSVVQRNIQSNSRYLMIAQAKSPLSENLFVHAFNMIVDEKSHIWILDGQRRILYDFDDSKDVQAFDRAFGMEEGHNYIEFTGFALRIYTGMFKPPDRLKTWREHDEKNLIDSFLHLSIPPADDKESNDSLSNLSMPELDKSLDNSLLDDALSE